MHGGGREDDTREEFFLAGTREKFAPGILQHDVEDDLVEGGIVAVAVAFPAFGVEIDFEVAVVAFFGTDDGGVLEIGAGAAIPLAGVDEGDFFPAGRGEFGAEEAGKPE